MPFVLERIEESAVFHFFEDLYCDAAGYVDATQSEDFERKVTCFGAIDVGPEVDGSDTDGASFVEAVLSNFRSRVGVGVGEGSVFHGRIEKFVNGAEAAAGKNQLEADLRITAAHEAKQFDLRFGGRSEIGMATLGGADLITGAVPEEKRFAQAGGSGKRHPGGTGLSRD